MVKVKYLKKVGVIEKGQIVDVTEEEFKIYVTEEHIAELVEKPKTKEQLTHIKNYLNSQGKHAIIRENEVHIVDEETKKKEEENPLLTEKETQKELKRIYKDLIKVLKKFCDLKEDMYPIVAVWIIGTYIHDEFETFPYLFFNAMRGSGKTRILRLIAALSNNGELLGSMSEAVLFRTAKGSTMCIDEFEQVNNQEKQSLRELLNSAYKKGQKIKRMKQLKRGYAVEEFEVYTSICMANIWGMEEVLGDRCIQITLEKSSKPEITKLIEDFSENPEITTLKSQFSLIKCSLCSVVSNKVMGRGWNDYILNEYTLTTHHTYNTDTTPYTSFYKMIDKTGIDGRDFELTFPLFAIARFLGSFKDFLLIMKKMMDEKKVEYFAESKDVQLFDFASKQDSMNFVSITKLTNQFREFIGVKDKEETYVNNKWMGRALKRLVLIKEKVRKSGGVEIIIDVANAQNKMEMFK